MNLKKIFGIFIFGLICTSIFAIEFTASKTNGSVSFNFQSNGKLIVTLDGSTETVSYTGNPNANGKIILNDGSNSITTEIYDGIMDFMGIGIESTASQKRSPIKTFTATYGNEKISVGFLNSKYVRVKIDSDDSYQAGSFALKYSGDYTKNGPLTATIDDTKIRFELYDGLLIGYNIVLRDTKNVSAKPLKTFYLEGDSSSYITVENNKIISISSKNWSNETITVGATYTGSFLKDGNVVINIYNENEPSTENIKVSNGCILLKSKLFKAKDSRPLGKFICADNEKKSLIIDSDSIFTNKDEYYTEAFSYTGNFFADGQIKYYDDLYTLEIKNGYLIKNDNLYYDEKKAVPELIKEFVNIDDNQYSFSIYADNLFKYKLYSDRWGTYEGDIQKGNVSKIEFYNTSYNILQNKSYILYNGYVFADKKLFDDNNKLITVASYSAFKKKNEHDTFKYEFYENGLFCKTKESWTTQKTYGFYEGDPSRDGKIILTLNDGTKKEITVSNNSFNGPDSTDKDKLYYNSSSYTFKESVYVSKNAYNNTVKYSFTDQVNFKKITVSKSGKETVREGTYTGLLKAGSTIKINLYNNEEEIAVGENFFWGTGFEKNNLYILEGTSLGDSVAVFNYKDNYYSYDYKFLRNGILQIDTTGFGSTKSEYKKYSGDPTRDGTISYVNSLNEETNAEIRNGAFLTSRNEFFISGSLKTIASFQPMEISYGSFNYIFYEGKFIEKQTLSSSGECYNKSYGTYDGKILSDRNIKIKFQDEEENLKVCQPYLFDGTKKYVNQEIINTKGEPKVLASFIIEKPSEDSKAEGSFTFYDNNMFTYTFIPSEYAYNIQGTFEGVPEKNHIVNLEYWKKLSGSSAKTLTINDDWFYGIESNDKKFIYVNSKSKQQKPIASFTGNDEEGNLYTIEFTHPVSFEIKSNGTNIKSGYYFGDPSSDGKIQLKELYNNSEIKTENGTFNYSISGKDILFHDEKISFSNFSVVDEFSNESKTKTYRFLENSVLEIKDNSTSESLFFKYTGSCKNGERISFGTSIIKINGNGFILNNSLFTNKNFRTLETFSATENSRTYKYLFHEGNYLEYRTTDDNGNTSREYYTYYGNPSANETIIFDSPEIISVYNYSQKISIRNNAFIRDGKLFSSRELKTLAVYSASDKTSSYKYLFHENNYLEYQTKDSSGTTTYVYSTYEGNPAADGTVKLFAEKEKSFDAKIKKGILYDRSKLKFKREN